MALSPASWTRADASNADRSASEHRIANFQPPVPRPDLVLRCPDATSHHAHEAILSLHSSVIQSMIEEEKANQPRDGDHVHTTLELEVESDTLVTLLEICYGNTSSLPSSPLVLAALLVAVERYKMVLVQRIVQDRWDEVAKSSSLDAYFVALRHGLTPHARLAAKEMLKKPINGAYARTMESAPALSYHRLLEYYIACGAAVKVKGLEAIATWDNDMRNAQQRCYSYYSSSHNIQEGGSMGQYVLDMLGKRSDEGPGSGLAELAFSSLLMRSGLDEYYSIWPSCGKTSCPAVVQAVLTLSNDLEATIAEAISEVRCKGSLYHGGHGAEVPEPRWNSRSTSAQ